MAKPKARVERVQTEKLSPWESLLIEECVRRAVGKGIAPDVEIRALVKKLDRSTGVQLFTRVFV